MIAPIAIKCAAAIMPNDLDNFLIFALIVTSYYKWLLLLQSAKERFFYDYQSLFRAPVARRRTL